MNINRYYEDEKLLIKDLKQFEIENLLRKESFAKNLVQAHIDKAKHNLKFVNKNITDEQFNDWTITGLYYAAYHAALALIANKGYISKSHDATLLFIIKEYKISKKEAEFINEMAITKTDAEFYATLKEKRKQATYSTNTLFNTEKVKEYRERTIEFINKTEEILENI
jgi:uncharacterized protein (UPF0332 family)